MREVIWKSKFIHSTLLRKLSNAEKRIANAFNNFSINIGPNLADYISMATRSFDSYLQKTNEILKDGSITINELKDNKSAGYDEISFNVMKNCFVTMI